VRRQSVVKLSLRQLRKFHLDIGESSARTLYLSISINQSINQSHTHTHSYMMKAKPYISIFENTYNAPWYMMRQYLECKLPLWTVFLTEGSSKKGGKKKTQSSKMPLMTFLPKPNGKWQICDIPGNVGVRTTYSPIHLLTYPHSPHTRTQVRREAYIEGYVENNCDDRSKVKPLIHDKRRDPNKAVKIQEFVKLYGLDMCKHTLIFDNGGVEFKTQLIKLDTKKYGLPQTRQRGYLFVWRRDWTMELEKPLEKIDMTVGDLFLDLVESLAVNAQFPLHGLLPKDIDPRVRRFREVLRGPIGARTARDLARNNDFLDGKSSNTKYSDKVRQPPRGGSQENYESKLVVPLDHDPKQLTGWGADGALRSRMYGVWPELLRLYDQRKRDLLEVFASKVATLPTPRDALHHAFSWDISQNVHMAQPNSRPGITGCLTPGGYIFLPCMSRCLTGAEKLLFNGIPVDRLQIGQETEVQLSDLAGNAMSLTVVSACTLAALCVKEYVFFSARSLSIFSYSL